MFEDRVQLVKYDDMKPTVISLLFVLMHGQNIANKCVVCTNLLLCICEKLSDIFFRGSYIFVQNFWAVDNFWLSSIEHLPNLPCNEGFTSSRRTIQQNTYTQFTDCRVTMEKNVPLTCWIPNFSTSPGGNTLDANARRNIAPNSSSRPPMPMSSNLKLGAMIALVGALLLHKLPSTPRL